MPERKSPPSAVTEELREWSEKQGPNADDALFNLVYVELQRQARRYLRREQVGHTLQTTALVHEVYLKLSKQRSFPWQSRSQFYGIAAKLMRQILIDHARSKHRLRRGGVQEAIRIDSAFTLAVNDHGFDLLELNEVL